MGRPKLALASSRRLILRSAAPRRVQANRTVVPEATYDPPETWHLIDTDESEDAIAFDTDAFREQVEEPEQSALRCAKRAGGIHTSMNVDGPRPGGQQTARGTQKVEVESSELGAGANGRVLAMRTPSL
ncbi:MAG: hypothetical protein IPK13_28080 [Deltaproteobacteria bacterium]|nr:hypothetical protein [Deltaproteobacteria bacterium]